MLNGFSQRCLLAAVILLTASSSVISKEISWDYIQGTYASVTDSSLSEDVDGKGLGVSGSFSINQNVALGASYSWINYDKYQGILIDTSSFTFGVDLHTLIASGTAVHGFFSVLKAKGEATGDITTIDEDDTGYTLGVGLRHMATDAIELDIDISRTDVFEDKSNTLRLGARYYSQKVVSFGIDYLTGDDVDSLLLSVRVSF